MSDKKTANNDPNPQPSTEKKHKNLESLTIHGDCILTMGMSMLYADILSQELSDQIKSPEIVSLVQFYLKDRRPEDMDPSMFPSILEQVPEGILDTAREAIFSSGALNRKMECQIPIEVGKPFRFSAPRTLVQLDILDGRLAQINPTKPR